jgi:hypothetical protein
MRVFSQRLVTLAVVGYLAYVLGRHAAPPPEALPTWPEGPQLEALPDTVYLRFYAKGQIARDAAAGRRSLFEAAALFRELNRLPPALPELSYSDRFDTTLVVHNDEERLCRQVIWWVGATITRDGFPERVEATQRLLKDVLRAEIQKSGTIRLPEPATLEPAGELLERCRDMLPGGRSGRRGS